MDRVRYSVFWRGRLKQGWVGNRFLRIGNPRTGRKLKVKSSLSNGYSVLSFQHDNNGNCFARQYLKERFNLKRTYSINAPKDNYIPIYYRKVMKENGVTYSHLRDLFYDHILKSIEDDIQLLIKWLNENTEIKLQINEFEFSFQDIEISYDIITPRGIKLSDVDSIKDNFDDLAFRSSSRSLIDSNSNSICYTPLPKTVKLGLNDYGNEIKGYCTDNSEYIIYTKECSQLGNQSRFEQRFTKTQIVRHCGSGMFSKKSDVKRIMSLLADITFQLGIKTISRTPPMKIKGRKKIIKGYCKSYFGKHWLSAYRLLTSKSAQICTNKGSKAPKVLIPLTRKIKKKNAFIHCPKKGYYKINWRWVNRITKL